MTLAATTVQTTGSTTNGSTTLFSFSFRVDDFGDIEAEDQLEVVLTVTASGVETTLTRTTHYTVSINGDQDSSPGGSISTVSTYATGYTIYIRRAPSFLQNTSLQNQGAFNAEVIETTFDQTVKQVQDLRDRMLGAPYMGVQKGSSFNGRIRSTLTGKGGYLVALTGGLDGYELVSPTDSSSELVTASGATTANTNATRASWIYDVRDFGAITLADNAAATTNATTINAAITAIALLGGGFALLPRGVIWSGAITLKTGVYLVGQKSGTTLKAKNSLNANFIEGENTASLYAGTTTGGIYDAGLIDLVVDGNKANQSSGHAVRIYGRSIRIECVSITNAKERGLSTKWGNPGLLVAPVARGVENIIRNVYIDFAGQEGFYHEGPNDSYHSDVIVVSCGQDTTNTYDNVVATGTYGHAHWTRLHSWRWSPGSYAGFVYPRYALRVESEGNEFDSCDLEGGYSANVYITGSYNAFNATCSFYAVRNGGSNVIIRGSFNVIHGRLTSPESGTCKGIVLGTAGGDTVTHNMIDVVLSEQQAGLVDWTNSDGFNIVKARGYNSAGTFQVGTRNANDVADIVISGSGGGTLQESGLGYKYSVGYLKRSLTTGISAAGTTQGTATALSADNDVHYVGTVAANTGVLLPDAGAAAKLTVINDGANPLNVYPPSGHTISGGAANAAKVVAAGSARTFIQVTTTYWAAVSTDANMTAYGRSIINTANEAAFKALVNLEANIDFYAPGGTDVAVADGGTGDSGTAWTSYTPTLTYPTTAPTTAVVSARYKTLGKTMWVSIDYNVTSLGAGAGNVRFSMPAGAVAALVPLSGYNNDAGTVQAAFANASLNCIVLVPSPSLAAHHYYIGGVLELT